MAKKVVDIKKTRIKISAFLFLTAIFALIVRLGYIQIVAGPTYSQEAMKQQYKDTVIYPMRGIIYDRTGKELAVSVPKNDLWIEPDNIKDSEKDAAIETLSKILELDKEEIKKSLSSGKKRFALAKNIDSDKVKKIREAKISGIWFEQSSRRYYPYGKFASYVIGHVSNENVGLAGVEASFNTYLKGIPGREIFIKDARNREISTNSLSYNEPVNGRNLILTIDEVIQHHMERAVEQALVDTNAKRVIAIAMDPQTGDILGMVSKPDYDPNDSRTPLYPLFQEKIDAALSDEEKLKELYTMWRNPAVNDIYEPGSPFKVVTASAALEEGLVYPEEWFNDIGYTEVAGRKIKNWTSKPFGSITFTKAVEQSVNSTFIQIAQRLGAQKFTEYITAFGFGKPTGIALPGEGVGMQYTVSKMGPVELATTSFGQSIAVTPIQMVSAISAVANDGKLMKPRIVKEVTDENGEIVESFEPEVVKRAVSKTTADQMLAIMESVVANGSGSATKIDGYRIGGKTGTAQKVIDGKYQSGYYISSCAAVAPIEDPQVALLVIVDEPKGASYFGSTISAPVVRQIMQDILRYLGVKPNAQAVIENNDSKIVIPEIRNRKYSEVAIELEKLGIGHALDAQQEIDTSGIVIDSFPKPGDKVPQGSSVMLYIGSSTDETIIMPDLSGKTVKEVTELLKNMGLEFTPVGSGKAVKQMPSAGTMVKKGNMASVEFE